MEFSERLKKLVEDYNNRHLDDFTAQVLDEVTKQLNDLLKDIQKDKEHFKELGISFEEKAFYDILVSCAQKFHFENQYPDNKMKNLAASTPASHCGLQENKQNQGHGIQQANEKAG